MSDPRYVVRTQGEAGTVVWARWQCSYCEGFFRSRKGCEKHMGLVANIMPSCPELRKKDEAKRKYIWDEGPREKAY